MKLKNIVLFVTIIVTALSLQAASNQPSYDLSTLARYLTSNENSAANQTATQAATQENSFLNQNSLATLNTMLNSTPDTLKATVLDKIPTSWKIYLVKLIEFVKTFLNNDSKQSLQQIQNILQQNIAAPQQPQEHTAAFQQVEQ